jgi:hypothetical protein
MQYLTFPGIVIRGSLHLIATTQEGDSKKDVNRYGRCVDSYETNISRTCRGTRFADPRTSEVNSKRNKSSLGRGIHDISKVLIVEVVLVQVHRVHCAVDSSGNFDVVRKSECGGACQCPASAAFATRLSQIEMDSSPRRDRQLRTGTMQRTV